SPPELPSQARPDPFQLIARRTHSGNLQTHGADAKPPPNLKAVHVEARSRDVFPDASRCQVHRVKGLAINQKDLSLATTCMRATLQASIRNRAHFRDFLHR